METKKTILLIIAASVFGAFCSAATISYLTPNIATSTSGNTEILDRLAKLEQTLAEERQASSLRQEIYNNQVNSPQVESAQLSREKAELDIAATEDEADDAEVAPELNNDLQSGQLSRFARSQSEYKKQVLVNAGFSEDEASWVVQSESEVVLQQLYDQYESQRKAFEQPAGENATPSSQQDQLRAKIGDDYYERYLKANGWPTTVGISSVIPGSPGYNAGLQPGDKIVSYGGQRVFRLRDVNNLTIEGRPGDSVLIEIERDGNPLQLTIPRGPIGIQGTGRFRR